MGITACAECARNCLVIHGKNKEPSPVVQSFFKIMIGNNYPKVLFLPPKISRTMLDLVSKETQLEDSSGQRWTVTLSRQEESLAFLQGWPAFSQEHSLKVGDLLVFHYILGSHFVVQIFGRNGCEKLQFSTENGSRKKRRKTPSGAECGKDHSIGRNSMNKEGQDSSALSSSNTEIVAGTVTIRNGSARKVLNEEQLCMIGMDARHRHENHQNSLYDLPTFEMWRTSIVDANAGVLEHEMSPCHGNRMLTSQAGEYRGDRIPVTEEVVASDVPNLEFPDANEDFQMIEKVVPVSTKDPGDGNTIGQERRTSNVDANAGVLEHEMSPCHGNRMSTPQAGEYIVDRIPVTEEVVASDVPNLEFPDANEDFQMIEKVVPVSTKDPGDGNTIGHERRTSNVDANAGVLEHEMSPSHGNRMSTPQAGEYIVDRIPVTEEVVASDVPNLELPDANEDFQMTEKVVLVSTKDSSDGNTIGHEQSEKRKSRKCPEPKDSGNSSSHPARKEDHIFKAVKAELVDTFDLPSAESGTTSLRVTETKAFLDLPRGLPFVKAKLTRGNPSSRRAVIFLRDPGSRLWPVIYHERSIIKALTGGWEAFTKENSIQPGDDCSFEVENKDEGIYKVSIFRR